MKALILLLLPLTLLAEEPWGKDADLTRPKICREESEPTWASKLGVYLIRFHQEVISPADGPRSHYYPSSSQYTRESMQKYGFVQGWLMGCDRLMRENNEDWHYTKVVGPEGNVLKLDPVR